MLHVVRAMFVLACGTVGWVTGIDLYQQPWLGLIIGLGAGTIFMVLQMLATRQLASVVVTLVFGILVGCLLAFFLIQVLDLLDAEMSHKARTYRNFALAVVLSFLSVLTILHVKDDFKFVIPFIELKREGGGGSKPVILDTSAIIDGRIADVMDTKIIDVPVVIPRFVLTELQAVADSQDALKRVRGRRGLDVLNRLRKDRGVRIEDAELPEIEGVDAKLVRLAKNLDARILTTDFNLNKVAQVQGVEVINLNDLAHALRPDVLPGEKLTVKILRAGENAGQGVAYLDDGTMVVAEECAGRIGQAVEVVITNVRAPAAPGRR